MEIAVLIPCYNEESTVAKVVQDFKKALPEAKVYVYDNNSTDKTFENANNAGAIVRKSTKQGKGNVVKDMFNNIKADIYLMVDGDDTYPANRAKEMVRLVKKKNVDMVIGDRLSSNYHENNERQFHGFGNEFIRKIINSFYSSNITDVMTGYRAFSKKFVRNVKDKIKSEEFEIETELTIMALENNMNIVSLPIEYGKRPEGSVSKLSTIPDGLKIVRFITNHLLEKKSGN